MIPKIFVIMAWIMVIGVQVESNADPGGKTYENINEWAEGIIGRSFELTGECLEKMGTCANSCRNMSGKRTPVEDLCKFIHNLRKGCFSTCPPCAQEKLDEIEEKMGQRTGCDLIVGNYNTLCAREAVIMNVHDCERAATQYGKKFKKIKIDDVTGAYYMGGCSMKIGSDDDTVYFNFNNDGFIQPFSKPICRRQETLEKKAKDEMFKAMIQTIPTAKKNNAQISYLKSKVNTVVELEPFVNGQWSKWGDYSPCSKSCGTGQKTKTRSCNTPSPSGGGFACPGLSSESINCNTESCPDSCKPNPCLNDGICTKKNHDYECDCKEGWAGKNCHCKLSKNCRNTGVNCSSCRGCLLEHSCLHYDPTGRSGPMNTTKCSQAGGMVCADIPDSFPTYPGCWIRLPSGCPNQKSRPQYDHYQNAFDWYHHTFNGASNSRRQCLARKGPLNNWCGVDDIIVRYL